MGSCDGCPPAPFSCRGSGQRRARLGVRHGFRSRGDRGRVGSRHRVGARGCRRGRARWGRPRRCRTRGRGRGRGRRGRLRAGRRLRVRHRIGARLRGLGLGARCRPRRHGVGIRIRHEVLQPVARLRLWTTPPPTRRLLPQSPPGGTGRGQVEVTGAEPGHPRVPAREPESGDQKRPGCSASQSFAAVSRSWPAGGASSGWRSAHLAT
ncbi:hypothetical protein GTY47_05175 [Streptomyces sp. SID5464]|nr:hypothetical protein [Streptomyces sp. SID5464]